MPIPTTDSEIESRLSSQGRTDEDVNRDIARAIAQGATLGFSDEIYGLYKSFTSDKTYEEARDEIREGLNRFRDLDPIAAYGFEILGGMLTGGGAAYGAGRAGIAAGMGRATALGAAEGAAYGAGTGETAGERAVGAVTGAGLGYLGAGFGEKITPRITGAAKEMMSRGYPLTAGQAMGGAAKSFEERVSLPFLSNVIQEAQQRPVRMFRREAVENALEGIGAKLPKGLQGEELVEAAEDAVSEAYEKVVPKLSINTQPVSEAANSIAGRLKMSGEFSDADVTDFQKLIAGTFNRNITDGKLSKQMLKDTESEISSEIRSLMRGGMNDRRMGKALKEFQEAFRNEITKQNKNVPDLQPINRAFARLKPISKAKDIALGRGGEFTPVQLLRAQRQMGVPRTAPEVQMARQARDVLNVGTGTSGSAERIFASKPLSTLTGASLGLAAEPMYSGAGQKLMRGLLGATGRGVAVGSPVGSQIGLNLLTDDPMTVSP
jgi:hypothetical protein